MSNIAMCLRGFLALVIAIAGMVSFAATAHATAFTTTVPDGNGQIPNTYPPVGGTVVVLIGTNGNIYYQFVNPSTQYEGFYNDSRNGTPAAFEGNPFQLGPTQALNCGPTACVDYFGGGIAKMYVRLTVRDGDTCPGNFDFNRVEFRLNGRVISNFTGPLAERTNPAGTTSYGFENCFRDDRSAGSVNGETSTAWFESEDQVVLDDILATGSTTPQIFSQPRANGRPNGNYWYFRDGIDATGTPEVAPGVRITKTADRTSYAAVGDIINYSFFVENIGSVRLTNVQVTDPFITGAITCPRTVLDSAQNMICMAQHVVTQANIDNDIVFVNEATVTGNPTEGTLGAVSGTVTIPGPPANNTVTLTKTASKDTNVEEGDTITYTYVATNTGNITIENVNITDNHSGNGTLSAITPSNVTLAPNGGSQTFQATYIVTQADIDSGGAINNTATFNGTPKRGALPVVTATETITPIAAAPASTLTKTASQDTNAALGDMITYTYVVRNTGNVSLNNIMIADNHGGTGALSAITPANVSSLAPNTDATFTATYTITQADIDAGTDIANTATANATPASGSYTPPNATETVSLIGPTPEITFTKTATDTTDVAAGDVITYNYSAENTGNVLLTNVTVTDNHNGAGSLGVISPASIASLPVGQVATFSANYTVTQADIDAGVDITNTATVTATPSRGNLPVTTASEIVDVANPAPAFTMVKTATTPSFAAVGDIVSYDYKITNTGNVSISAVTVADDKIATVTCPAGEIAPTEMLTCSADYSVTQLDLNAGSVTNNATANGTPTGGTLAPALANETVSATQTPKLTLVKTATVTDFANVGDTLEYDYLVTNTGNVEITNIVVTDDKIASVSCPVTTLAPTEDTTCTASYSVTQADLDLGSVTNNASVNGTPAGGTLSPATAQEIVGGTQAPALTLAKSALDSSYAAVGDQIEYSYLVTNSGNVTITDPITVDDDKITVPQLVVCPALPSGGLPINGTLTCSATYMVTQADLDAGFVTNTATATDGNVTSPSSAVTVNATQSPAMTLVKDAVETEYNAVGDTLSYTYTVTNTGNVLIANLVVTDDLIPSVTCNVSSIGNGDTNLDPLEVAVCTGTYTVTQADLDAGSVTNNASANGAPSGGTLTPPTDNATVMAEQLPALTLIKTANETSFDAVGDILTYNYAVTNSGNVLISNISVSDDKIATVTCDVTAIGNNDASLDPTETVICKASYTVLQADLDAGQVTNNATATGVPAGGTLVDANDDATVTASQNPAMSVMKTATVVNFELPGDVTTYEYVVTNTGNVTLTDAITVTDNLISAVTCPPLPSGGLLPAATLTCSATYTVTQADLDAGSVTNLASATSGGTTSPQTSETIPATQDPALVIEKAALFSDFTSAGEVVEYEYTVRNTGNLTLTGGINVVDDKIGTINCVATNLVPGGVATCRANYTITQADVDLGLVTNQAFGRNGTLTSPPVDVTVTGTQTATLGFTKRALDTSFTKAGDTIDYEFDVQNTGNVTLASVAVQDDLIASVSCPKTTLAPMEAIVCSAQYTVTQMDVDAGAVINNAVASGNPPTGPPASTPSSATVNSSATPSFSFAKRAIDLDFANVGDVLDYEFDVQNTGDITLSNIIITDDLIATVSCPMASLAPTQSMVCSASYAVKQTDIDAGQVINNATAKASLPDGTNLPDALGSATVSGTQSPALTVLKQAVETDFAQVGDVLNYTYLITNTGNVNVTNIAVADDRIPSLSCPSANLAPAANVTCTGTYTVTQEDINTGFVTNNVSVTGTPAGGTLAPALDQVTVTGTQSPAIDIVKTATTSSYASVGDTINYDYVLTNSGNVTLKNALSISDDKIPSVSCPALPMGGLPVNGTLTCNATYVVTQADIDAGLVTNIATATDGTTSSPTATETVNADQSPSLATIKTATPQTFASLGELINYEYRVTNTGNVTITSPITVTDDKIASVTCPAMPAGGLAPKAVLTCSATYTITQADLDSGSVTNAASSSDGTTISPIVRETVTADQMPSVTMVKTAQATSFSAVGELIQYNYDITNSGNVTITTPVTVADDKIASVTCPALPGGRLAPQAVLTCSATYAVTQADIDAGFVTNLASASTSGVTSPIATETVTADQLPALSIVKSALNNTFAAPGDVIDYEYRVRNSGNVTLIRNVMVTDDKIAAISCPSLPVSGLLPNGEIVCTGRYVVNQSDIDAGFVTNIASATNGTTSSPTDTVTVNATQTPALTTIKRALETTYDMPGDVIAYEYDVVNSGNVTITAPISVADDKIATVTCPALPAGGLLPSASITCTGNYSVTQADIDAGTITNIASATDGTTMSPEVSKTINATRVSNLDVEKNAVSINFNLPGDVTTYEYIVTNLGNVTIVDPITVSDNLIPSANVSCPALPAGGLAPNGTLRCTGAYIVTQDNLDVGSVTNVASATDGTTTSSLTSETIPATQNPALEVRKTSPDTSFAAVGDILTYDFEIENTGNITLTGTFDIVDNRIGRFECFTGNLPSIAPGNIQACQETYTVTQADIDRGEVTNDAYADHPRASSPPAFVTIPADQMPALTLAKTPQSSAYARAGDTLDYSYLVTNSGNTTITFPIQVSDDRIANVICPALPVDGLAPLASLTCTGTDTVSQADIDTGFVENTATATDGTVTSQPQTARVNALQIPEISVNKIANDNDFTAEGDVLEYTFIVTNSGNVTITDTVTIDDSRIGTISCPALPAGGLAPNATLTCTASDIVGQTDMDAGIVENTATAIAGGLTSLPKTVTVTGTQSPALAVLKTANETSFSAVNETLSYDYIVTNTGNVTVTSAITVSDDKITNVTCPALPIGGLPPLGTVTCSAIYQVTQADIDAGFVTNIATATDGTVTSAAVSETVNATQTPALSMIKTAQTADFNAPRDQLSYEYVVTNSGNVTITQDIVISDDRIANVVCPALPMGGLLPLATLTCTGIDSVSQADLNAGQVTNTATASDGVTVSAPVSETIIGNQTSAFTVDKIAMSNDFTAVGDTLSYEYVVRNTGNITLTNAFTITDDKIGTFNCPALPTGGLVPNATLTCSADYSVTQEDLNAGEVTNIAFASSGGANSVSDEVTITGTQTPALAVVKSAGVSSFTAIGDMIPYSYVVTNTGNVTLINPITVTDDKIANVTCPALPANGLLPTATLTCSANYSVTQADLDAGQVTNIATATDGNIVSPEVSVSVMATQTSGLNIDKSAISAGFNMPGDVVSYEYVVTNSGNTTLLDAISVSDDKIASVTCPAIPTGGLPPQASLTCTADYSVTQADIDAGSVTNIATATAGNTTSAPDEVTVDAMVMPRLALSKTILETVQVGGPIYDVTYQITAENTGNVTLTDLQITDDLATFLAPAEIYTAPVVGVSRIDGASANASFDGAGNINLLSGTPKLDVGDIGTATILVRIDTTKGGPVTGNTAVATSSVLIAPVPSNDPTITPDAPQDVNPTPLSIIDTDGDGAPDNFESGTADRDGDGIPDSEDYDPTGYFYCEENGQILTGGGISVAGPNGVNASIGTANDIVIVEDGSQGYFQFYVTAPGNYRLTPTYPMTGVASTARPVQNVALDVTSLLPANPAVLGSSEVGNSGQLADSSAAANAPFYFDFEFEAGDPSVLMNNIPLKHCGTPEIALNKTALAPPVVQEDGRQRVSYAFTLSNTGETLIEDLQISDDLGVVFGADRVEIDRVEIADAPVNFAGSANPSYDGVVNTDLLIATGDLNPNESATINLFAFVNPANDGDYINTATATASEPLNGGVLEGEGSATVSLLPLSDAQFLRVTKTAQPRTVQIGDPVLYTISVTNESASTMSDLNIVDQLPQGFAYVPGTATVSDASTSLTVEPNVTSRGILNWALAQGNAAPLDTLQPNETLSVSLRLLAGPNVTFGAHENRAFVESPRTGTRSETATAVVDYIPEPSFDCTPVIGRVYDDVNHNGYPDDGEPGLPAVRLVTVNGDIITTDQYGRYHIPCAAIADSEMGSNFLLKTDTRTLPLGYKPTSENPRVVRATRGKFVKMNFGAAFRPKLRIDLNVADYGVSPDMLSVATVARIKSLLELNPTAERAILVYHADDTVDVDAAQASLQVALKAVRKYAPKGLRDIALEANWGEPTMFDVDRRAAGQAFSAEMKGEALKDNGRLNGTDRVIFMEDVNGDIDPMDRDDIRDRYEDDVWNNQTGLRGNRGSDALSGDNRAKAYGLGRRDNSEMSDTARPGRLLRWVGWGNKTSAYADGMEIETTTDSLDPVKRLNTQANIVATDMGREIRAEGYWNYAQFITRAELRVFASDRSTRGIPLAVSDFNGATASLPITPDMLDTRRDMTQLQYVLRVYGTEGEFDETAPKVLRLGEPELDLTASEWANEAQTAFGQNTLLISNVTVRGGVVRVYGRNVPGESVNVMGQIIDVDDAGRFVAEQLMPTGTRQIEIIVGDQRIVRTVDVKSRDTFYVAQIEATIGERIGQDKGFEEGRVAFYVRSRLNDRWSVTATADTGEAAIEDLLSGLDDKNLDQLLRRLDPDRYYPTYGDDSTIEQDAPTSGRMYARLEHDDDYLLWGNYQTNFGDTEYARVQRTLYGAKFHWDDNNNPTKLGDDRTSITAFLADGGTRQGRDELRGTGGSVYYLRRGDISIGSEILRVETRDSVSGLVIESRRLTYGTDYDLDFIQGRIILNQPLRSTGDDGRLFRDGSQGGNEYILVADYEFTPIFGSDDDAAVYGARASRWFGDSVKFGVSYNHDTDGGAESDLYGADLTLQYAAGTYIKGEVAQSEGVGVETFRSIDGGFTYNPRPRGGLNDGDTAMAYAIEAAADFAEFSSLQGTSYAYWRQREAGFAGYAETTNQTIEQYGGGFDLALTTALQFSGRADVSNDQTLGTNSFAEARLSYDANDKIKASIGASFNDDARGNSGTSVGARVDYEFADDSKVYAFGQVGVEGENTRTTDRMGIGAEVRVSKHILGGGEVSTGEDGLGARASVRYQYEDGDEFYLAYDLPLRAQAVANYGTFNLGARKRYGDALSIFGEERFQFNDRGLNGVTHAYGVDYKPGNWNLGLSGEVGRVDELDRIALSGKVGFGDERMKAGIAGEWREDENVTTGDVRRTWLLRATSQYQASEELRLQGKLNLAFSDQTRDSILDPQDFNQAEFTEGSLAAAYRPIWDDRFNLLAKYVYLEDLSPTSQRFNGETINYRQKSEIGSVDASYDVSAKWTLGGKYAHRAGSVTSNRESLDFTKSTADLGVIRLDYHVTHQWDAMIEGRYLSIGDGTITRQGGMAGIYRHLNDNAKIGVGLTWGGIEEEYLAPIGDEDDMGWYLNVVGKF
ncbi:hypothetical protein AB8615_10925 [Litorimonas sp. RW-G-Af-16]|uniref:DUF7507 domain-containing protein n=1 Tax=Litorimonas sp. RW-G-Af-16 TaxID=3241168 RepID=UPI003AADA685